MGTMMWGADVEQLRSCAGTFGEGADLLDQSRATIDSALGSAPWVGRDSDDFQQAWAGTTAPQLQAIADALRQGAADLERHAGEQTDTSTGGGVGAGRAGGVGGLFDRLLDWLGFGDGGSGGTDDSFSDEVYGQDPQEIDREFADLVNDVYPGKDSLPEGWERVSDDDLADLGIDPDSLTDDSGFDAAIYVDEDGNYVLAFAGTDEGGDWIDNAQQGAGFSSDQYNRALELGKEAKAAFGDDLVITGHSLGGGLASHAAIATDTPAVTFNAAGLHDDSIEAGGVDPSAGRQAAEDGLIRAYRTDSDILTHIQEGNITAPLAPNAAGNPITLNDPESADLPSWWHPIDRTTAAAEHRVEMHGMDAVRDALDNDQPWN